MILLLLAASLSAMNEFVGPPVVAPTLVSAPAAMIKSFALFVVAVGVVGVVLIPALVAGATSKAPLVATPENSLTFTPPLPTALAYVTVTELPDPELFNPYQISTIEWLPPTLPRTQLTPPPLTPLIDTLLLAENNTRALPACGAAFRLTTTLAVAPWLAAFC
jgi:hypothetical protein